MAKRKEYNPWEYENWKYGQQLKRAIDDKADQYDDKDNPYIATKPQPMIEEQPQDEGGFFSWVGNMFGSNDDVATQQTLSQVKQGAIEADSTKPLFFNYDEADDFTPKRVGAGIATGALVMADKNIYRTYKDKYGNRQTESIPIAKLHNDGSIKPAVYSNAAGFDFKLDAQEFDRQARLSQTDYKAELNKRAKRGIENMDKPFGTGFNSGGGEAASSFVDNLLFKPVTALSNIFGSKDNTHEGDIASNRSYAGQNTAVRDIAGMAGNIAGVVGTGGALGAGLKGVQGIKALPSIAKGAKYISETPLAFGSVLGAVTSAPENFSEYAKGDASLGGALVKTGIDMAGMGLGFKQGAKASKELREIAEDAGIRSLPFAKRMGTNVAEQLAIGTGQTIGDATMTSIDNASSAEARYKAGIADKPRSWSDEVYDAAIGSAGPNVAATLFFEMFGLAGMHGSVGNKVRSFSRDKYNAIKGKLVAAERAKLGITDVANSQDAFLNNLPEVNRPYTPTEVEDLVRQAKRKGLVDTRMTFDEKQYGYKYSEEERALRAKLNNRHIADPIKHTEAILERLSRGADEDTIIAEMKKNDLALLPSDEIKERAIIKLVAEDKATLDVVAKIYAEAKANGVPREHVADYLVEKGMMPNAEMADLILDNIDDAIAKGYSVEELKPQYYRDENGNMVYRPVGIAKPAEAVPAGVLPSTLVNREAGYVEQALGMKMTPEVRSSYGGINREIPADGTAQFTQQELSATVQYLKTLLARPEIDKTLKKTITGLYDAGAGRNYAHPSGVNKLIDLYNRLEGTEGYAVVAIPDLVNGVLNKLSGSQPRFDFKADPFKYIKEVTDPLATPSWQDKIIADADRAFIYRELLTSLIKNQGATQAQAAEAINLVFGTKLKGEGDESRLFSKAIANKTPEAINKAFERLTQQSLYNLVGYVHDPIPETPTNVAEAEATQPTQEVKSDVGTAPKVEDKAEVQQTPRELAYAEPVIDNTPLEPGTLIGDNSKLTPLERRLLDERKLAVRAEREGFGLPENYNVAPEELAPSSPDVIRGNEDAVQWNPADQVWYETKKVSRPALGSGEAPIVKREDMLPATISNDTYNNAKEQLGSAMTEKADEVAKRLKLNAEKQAELEEVFSSVPTYEDIFSSVPPMLRYRIDNIAKNASLEREITQNYLDEVFAKAPRLLDERVKDILAETTTDDMLIEATLNKVFSVVPEAHVPTPYERRLKAYKRKADAEALRKRMEETRGKQYEDPMDFYRDRKRVEQARREQLEAEALNGKDLYENADQLENRQQETKSEYKPKEITTPDELPDLPKLPASVKESAPIAPEEFADAPDAPNTELDNTTDVKQDEGTTDTWNMVTDKGKKPTPLELAKYNEHLAAIDKPGTEKQIQKHKDWVAKFEQKYQKPIEMEKDYAEPTNPTQEAEAVVTESGDVVAPNEVSAKEVPVDVAGQIEAPVKEKKVKVKKTTKKQKQAEEAATKEKVVESIAKFDDMEQDLYSDLQQEFSLDETGTFRGKTLDELIGMPDDKRLDWLESEGYADPDLRDDLTYSMFEQAREDAVAKEPLGFYGIEESKALKLTKKDLAKLGDKYRSLDIAEEYAGWKKDYAARKEAVDVPGNDINADYIVTKDNGDGTVTQTGKGGFEQTKTVGKADNSLNTVLEKLRNVSILGDKFKVEYNAANDRYTIHKDSAPISELLDNYEAQFKEHLTDEDIAVLENTPRFQQKITAWSYSPSAGKRTEAMLKREAGLQVARGTIGTLAVIGGANMETDDKDYDFIKQFLIFGGTALIASDAYVTIGRRLRNKNIPVNQVAPKHKFFAGMWRPKNVESLTAKNMAEQKVKMAGENSTKVQEAIDMWNNSNEEFKNSTFKANRSLAHIKGELPAKLQRSAAEGQILKDRAIHEIEQLKDDVMKQARHIPGMKETEAISVMARTNDAVYTETTKIQNDPYLSKEMKSAKITELTTPEAIKERIGSMVEDKASVDKLYDMYVTARKAQDRVTYHDVAATLMNYYGVDIRKARTELNNLGDMANNYVEKIDALRADMADYRKEFAKGAEVKKARKSGKSLKTLLGKDAQYSRMQLELITLKGQYSPIKNKIRGINSGLIFIKESEAGHHLLERWAKARENSKHALSIYEISGINDGAKRVHENSSKVNEFHHFDTHDSRTAFTNKWLQEHNYKPVEGYPNVYEVTVKDFDGNDKQAIVQLNDKIDFDANAAVRITNFKRVRQAILKIARDEMDLNVFKKKATAELEALREQYSLSANNDESMTDIDATMVSNIDSLLNLAEGMSDKHTLVKNLNDMFTYVLNPKAKTWYRNKNAIGYAPAAEDAHGWFELWDKGMAKAMRRFSNTYISATLTRELDAQLLQANSLGVRNDYTEYLHKLYDDVLYQGPTVNYLDDVINNKAYKFAANAERVMTSGAIGLNATVPIKNITSGLATNVAGLISRGMKLGSIGKTRRGLRDALKGEVTKPVYGDEMLDAIHASIVNSRIMNGTSIEQLSELKGHSGSFSKRYDKIAFAGMKFTETMNRYMGAMAYAMNAMNDVPIETTGMSKKAYVKMITENAANFTYETQGNFDFLYRSPIEKMAIRNIPLGKHVLALQSPAINQLNFFGNTLKRMVTMPENKKREAGAMLGFLALSWFAGGVANVPGLADIMLGYDALNYDKSDKNSQRLVAKMEGVLVDALTKAGMDRSTAATMANIYRKGGISTLLDKDVSMSQSAYEMLTPFMLQKIQSNWNMLTDMSRKRSAEGLLTFIGRNFVGVGRTMDAAKQLAAGEVLDTDGAPMGRKYGVGDFIKTSLFGADLNDKIAREDQRLGVRGVRTPQAAREFVRTLFGDGITFDGMKGTDANEAKAELFNDKRLEKLAPQLEEQYNKYYSSKLMQGIIERNTRKAEQFIEKNEKLLRDINPGEYVGSNKDYTALKNSISRDVKKFAELLAKQNVANKVAQKYGVGDVTLSAYGKYDLGEYVDGGMPLEEYAPSEQPYVYALVQFYKKASRAGAIEDEE